jgi:hypothetical protein
LQHAYRHVGSAAAAQGRRRLGALSVAFVDGTTCKMPRTPANVEAFGCPANQHGRAGLPVLRLVLLVCAGCGAVLDSAYGPQRLGELRLIVQVLLRLEPQWLLAGDALFGSYLNFALLRQRGCHGLFYWPAARKENPLRSLGRGDAIQLWHRPRRGLFAHLLSRVPETLEIRRIQRQVQRRGYRPWPVTVCTTLLDPKLYP